MGSVTSADGRHDYQRCTDENCPRFGCQAYKEGRELGEVLGRARGEAKGFEAGYKQGFAEGTGACPRPHGRR
jgi:hypothetical protein